MTIDIREAGAWLVAEDRGSSPRIHNVRLQLTTDFHYHSHVRRQQRVVYRPMLQELAASPRARECKLHHTLVLPIRLTYVLPVSSDIEGVTGMMTLALNAKKLEHDASASPH